MRNYKGSRLLIVDDNAALTWRLQSFLGKQFDVHIARTGGEGRRMAETEQYDAVILDLGLPDISGESVCLVLRQQNIATPILVLSGEGALESKVRLLDDGADDYLTKPFEPSELLARIRALVRRHPDTSAVTTLEVGDLIIDTARRTVTRAGVSILLRRKEFDLLEYMARNQGIIVTQAMILDHIWEDSRKDAWGDSIRVHIKHLRDKVDRPFATPLIRTARGVGYVLEG